MTSAPLGMSRATRGGMGERRLAEELELEEPTFATDRTVLSCREKIKQEKYLQNL
jgi:hypothetical protein